MKTYKNCLIAALLIVAAATFLGSCNLGPGSGSNNEDLANVTISIPGVSTSLATAFAAGGRDLGGEGSKALMFATHVQIEVYDPEMNQVFNSTKIAVTQATVGTTVTVNCGLPPDVEYMARVFVWNSAVHPTNYTLFAEITFTPIAGTVNRVSLRPLPVATACTEITAFGNGYSYNLMSSVYEGGAFTVRGGESWYRFAAPSEVVELTITPNSGYTIYAALFGSDGNSLASALSPTFMGTGPDNDVSFFYGTTTGNTYYLGFIEVETSGTGLNPCSGTVTVADGSASHQEFDNESNDILSDAQFAPCGEGTVPGTAYDVDWYYFTALNDGVSSIYVSFYEATFGSLRIYDSNENELGYDAVYDNSAGKTLFVAEGSFAAGNVYYIRADFYRRIAPYQMRSPAGMYTLAAGQAPPSAFSLPELQNVKKGQLLVNNSNPNYMGYVWISSADAIVHSISSTNAGVSWGSDVSMTNRGSIPVDFAADMDSNGNIVVLYVEADSVEAGIGSAATAFYGSRHVLNTTWNINTQPVWGTYVGGIPDTILYPSVYRSGNNLLFGYGFDLSSLEDGTSAHTLTWTGNMSGYSYIGIGGSAVDNPWSHQVAADSSGNSYYLYIDNRDGWDSMDVFLNSGGSDYVVAPFAGTTTDSYNAGQPFLFQRGISNYLLLYSVGHSVSTDNGVTYTLESNSIRARAASSMEDLGNNLVTTESTLVSDLLGNFPYPSTNSFRTYFAQMDSNGIVHVVYQGTEGNIRSFKIDGNNYLSGVSSTNLAWGTLDGIALNTEYGETVLYVSYHDSFGYGYVERVSNSPPMPE